jgi:ABC-type multidrug transport system ATPase subunit
MNVLEVHGLTKRYGKKLAVEDLTFSVQQGQIFGFLGPNGSGKTTTLGMIFGVIHPTGGDLSLFGRTNRQALADRRLGGTLEQPNLYPFLTGQENLHVVAAIKGLGDECIEPALREVNLFEAASREAKTYSLGMKQRLALAAAMLGDPEFLILDEPTNGLDPEGMREIRELILRLARSGRTILISTHLLDEVEKMCTHVAIINHGRLQRIGAVAELTGSSSCLRLSADSALPLFEAVSQYEFARNVRAKDGSVFLELIGGTPSLLNRHLVARGIYVDELTSQRLTLEQAFFAATESEPINSNGVAR